MKRGVVASALGLAMWIASFERTAHAQEDETCSSPDGPAVDADLRWTSGTSGTLTALVPNGFTYTLRVQARLGALRTEWTQPIAAADLAGNISVTVLPPTAAFLHELAEAYVTSLDVRVVGSDILAQKFELAAPPAFLAWPNGATHSPVVWDLGTMRSQAPAGVVDAAVRASLGDLTGISRVMAPIPFTTRPPADDDVVEGG